MAVGAGVTRAAALVEPAAGVYPEGQLVRGLSRLPNTKLSRSALAGWRVPRLSPVEIGDGSAVVQIGPALAAEGWMGLPPEGR